MPKMRHIFPVHYQSGSARAAGTVSNEESLRIRIFYWASVLDLWMSRGSWRLVCFYRSIRDWEAAGKVWTDSLDQEILPQFLTHLESRPPLPNQKSATEFAWNVHPEKNVRVSAARIAYERLLKICKSNDAPKSSSTLAVFLEYEMNTEYNIPPA